jgi:hypothetical protein
MKPKSMRERGQALILIAFAAIALFAITGLAIDGSNKYSDRRHAQNAADTAALAGALARANILTDNPGLSDSEVCPNGSMGTLCLAITDAALQRADDNGYDNNLVTNEVKVYTCNNPDSECGPYAGDRNYVQVIITSHVNTFFMRVIGIKESQNIVEAVALAGKGGILGDGAMIVSYDPDPNCSTGGTGGYSVQVSGSSSVNLNGGGIFLNSTGTCGFKIPNCADLNIYNGAAVSTVGANNIDTAGCTFDPPLSKNYSQKSIAIPDDVSWPDEPPECSMSGYPTPYKFPDTIVGADGKTHDQWLIFPGHYTEFPNPTLVTNKSYIYMASGVYCIELPANQALSWSAVDAAALIGSTDPAKNPKASYNPDGVTLYLKQAKGFALNGNGPTYLDAPTHGDYQGYTIIMKGTQTDHPSCTINGGAIVDLNGLIFAPYCNFTINGQAGETSEINAQIIGWDMKINGANEIRFNYNPDNAVKIKRKVGLMK